MNSSPNISKNYFSIILFVLLLSNFALTQDVPIPSNHLVHSFIERHITLGNISQNEISVRPYTYSYVRKVLNDIALIENRLTVRDKQLLQRFEIDFSIEEFNDKVEFPINISNFKKFGKAAIGNYKNQDYEPHFLTYKDSDIFAWANLSENVGLDIFDDNEYRRYTDKVSILGSVSGSLSFFVDFTMNRFIGDSVLVYQVEDYKNEDNPYFDYVNWTLWYQSNAAFNISTKYGDFKLAKTPIIWGYSPENSPILSGATQTYPFINYSYRNKFFGFHYLHASLLPYRSTTIHNMVEVPHKYLAGHRIEFYLGTDFAFSFSEIVIYGKRPIEVEYLIPVNFYWPAEHNQGDKDNLVMALDCSWRISDGLRWYNTLFWDELAWEKVLSKWWGNKFVFQSGVYWVSKSNPYLLDVRIEGTISRPWTYTHEDFITSYSSSEIGLGLPQGPNSQSLLIQIGMWPSDRWHMVLETMLLKKGIEQGSSVLDNYRYRDRTLDEDTPFILGEYDLTTEFRFETNYTINRIFSLYGWLGVELPDKDISGHFGLKIDW